jgi:hypothetical protein
MRHHLSEDQFANCVAGRAGEAELAHIHRCPECRAEVERFGNTISMFRSAVRDRVDARAASLELTISSIAAAPRPHGSIPLWRWAAVVALFVVVVSIPFFIAAPKPPHVVKEASTEMDPDALMRAVNLHLSRTVPAPMEPVLVLIPDNEPKIESGGVQ